MIIETLNDQIAQREVADIIILHGSPADYFAATYFPVFAPKAYALSGTGQAEGEHRRTYLAATYCA